MDLINGRVNYSESGPQPNDIDIMEYLFTERDKVTDMVRKHTNRYPENFNLLMKWHFKS